MRDQGQETLCGVLRSEVRARRASRGRNHVRIEGLSGAARRAVSQPSAPEGRTAEARPSADARSIGRTSWVFARRTSRRRHVKPLGTGPGGIALVG